MLIFEILPPQVWDMAKLGQEAVGCKFVKIKFTFHWMSFTSFFSCNILSFESIYLDLQYSVNAIGSKFFMHITYHKIKKKKHILYTWYWVEPLGLARWRSLVWMFPCSSLWGQRKEKKTWYRVDVPKKLWKKLIWPFKSLFLCKESKKNFMFLCAWGIYEL